VSPLAWVLPWTNELSICVIHLYTCNWCCQIDLFCFCCFQLKGDQSRPSSPIFDIGDSSIRHRDLNISTDNHTYILSQQLQVLTRIHQHFSHDDSTEVEQEDWQRLARVLDRMFLAFYIVCFIAVTIVFVVQMTEGDDGWKYLFMPSDSWNTLFKSANCTLLILE